MNNRLKTLIELAALLLVIGGAFLFPILAKYITWPGEKNVVKTSRPENMYEWMKSGMASGIFEKHDDEFAEDTEGPYYLSGQLAYYVAYQDGGFEPHHGDWYLLTGNGEPICLGVVTEQSSSYGFTEANEFIASHPGEAFALVDDSVGICAVQPDGTVTRLWEQFVHPELGYAECTEDYAAEHLDQLTFVVCEPVDEVTPED